MNFTCLKVAPRSLSNPSSPRLAQAKLVENGSPVTDATVQFVSDGNYITMNHVGSGHYTVYFVNPGTDPRAFYFVAVRSPYAQANGQYNTPDTDGDPAAYSSTGIC